MAEIEKVAFLGLGIMGSRMAKQLAGAGFDVTVWNRTRSKAEEAGLPVADTPAQAAAGADATITMVVDAPQVEEVLFGTDGAAESMPEGHLVVDMSTIAPTAARALAERLGERGVHFVDAPVSGSRPKAEDGTLTIMAGGSDADFERARPLFEAMGEQIEHVGPVGHGQMIKVITNMMGAVNAAALAEGLVMAQRAGLDMDAFLRVIPGTAGGSNTANLKARPMLEGDFEPLFKLEQMLKDVRHALEEAREMGLEPRFGELAERFYASADEEGLGEEDFAAVYRVVRGSGTP
jgi:3-hydroxyisobutyrate dehydrogenase-like beta-hydroxyacid dehydrogenase